MKGFRIAIILCLMVVLAACSSSNKELTGEEETALKFVTDFMNAEDADAKSKFINENVHPETQPLFELVQSQEIATFEDPQVQQSVSYEEDGKKVLAVLIKDNKTDEEVIVLTLESKVAWALFSSDDGEDLKSFEKAREKFE